MVYNKNTFNELISYCLVWGLYGIKRKCTIFFEVGGWGLIAVNIYHFTDLFHFDLQSHFKDSKAPQDEAPIHRIRITLTSRNVKSLEKGNGYLQILNVNARMQPDLQWFFVQ